MSDQIQIDHAELKAHAGKLLDVADDLSTEASTADGINLHDGAFGVMMAWLPGRVEALTPSNSAAIRAAEGAVRRTSTAVGILAQDFTDTDTYIAGQMNAIRG